MRIERQRFCSLGAPFGQQIVLSIRSGSEPHRAALVSIRYGAAKCESKVPFAIDLSFSHEQRFTFWCRAWNWETQREESNDGTRPSHFPEDHFIQACCVIHELLRKSVKKQDSLNILDKSYASLIRNTNENTGRCFTVFDARFFWLSAKEKAVIQSDGMHSDQSESHKYIFSNTGINAQDLCVCMMLEKDWRWISPDRHNGWSTISQAGAWEFAICIEFKVASLASEVCVLRPSLYQQLFIFANNTGWVRRPLNLLEENASEREGEEGQDGRDLSSLLIWEIIPFRRRQKQKWYSGTLGME